MVRAVSTESEAAEVKQFGAAVPLSFAVGPEANEQSEKKKVVQEQGKEDRGG